MVACSWKRTLKIRGPVVDLVGRSVLGGGENPVIRRFKRAILYFVRPVWRRIGPKFYSRVDTRIDMRLAQLDAGWTQHMPAILNAVSSVQSFGHKLVQTTRTLRTEFAKAQATLRSEVHVDLDNMRSEMRIDLDNMQSELVTQIQRTDARVSDAFERVEFVRSEILYEMKYAHPTFESAAHNLSPRILAPVKVEAALANGGLRINLGCGHIPLSSYVNVDMRDLPMVDVVADVGELPFEQGSVCEIFSAHLLEHFPQEKLTRALLPYWHNLLSDGGAFRAIVPDGEAMLKHLAEGSYVYEEFREVLFGAQEYDGDFHFNLLTPQSLSDLLQRAGFRDVTVPVRGRRNGKCYEFEVCATK